MRLRQRPGLHDCGWLLRVDSGFDCLLTGTVPHKLQLAGLRHVDKRHELVIVPTALRYPYLCSTVHVAHAHRDSGDGGVHGQLHSLVFSDTTHFGQGARSPGGHFALSNSLQTDVEAHPG